ncbi:ketoacyl-ACP synthase III family protein [Embleya sp. AB8]|uniref:ketoacyl-ACP synthase III family protein n=1 Tax=Embleya sp. AB8 TaxID=3156304 RepID=UPI003C71A4ED
MAVTAAQEALDRSKLDIDAIESHIHSGVYHQGPEGSYPPGYILRELGIANVSTLYLRQGCNGMLAALEVAVGQITGAAGIEAALLTTAQNFSTPLIDRWRGYGQSYILADGAAAALVGSAGGFAEVRSLASGILPDLEKWHRGEDSLLPPYDAAPDTFDVGKRAEYFHDSEMSLADTLESLSRFGIGIIHRALVDAGINAADLTKVVPINLDGRMVEYCVMAPLGLPNDRSSWDFGRSIGHAGAADVIISLDHLVRGGDLSPGDHVLLTSQGPGWICSAAVLTMVSTPS